MTGESRSEAWDRHLDWSLRAIQGSETPPDVTKRVETTVLEECGSPERPSQGRRLLSVAAAAILAIGAAVGVRLMVAQARGGHDDQSATQNHEPENHIVDDPKEVEGLPADARWVTVLRQGDDVLEQVAARCPRLQRLHVNCMEELRRQPTNRVFAIVATLSDLRELQLVKTVHVDGTGIEKLLDLPSLETLVLAMTQLGAACFTVLPRMPSLRILDLSYSRGVDEGALQHIARCPGLRQLGIPGCEDVTSEGLQHVAEMTMLEVLEARQLHCAFDDFPIERLQRLTTADLADARFAPSWLRRLPGSLRKLTLSQTSLDDDGCAVLAERLLALRDLRGGGTAVGDRGVVALVQLAELRTLDLGGCPAVTAASLEVLMQHPQLTAVELTGAPWVTPQNVRPLFERGIGVRMNSPAEDHALEPLRRRHAAALSARARRAREEVK